MDYLVNDPSVTDEKLSDFTFSVMNDCGEEVELVDGGSEMPVTLLNRKEYGRLIAKFYLK